VHLTTLSEEVKDGEIVAKMLRSLPPHFKQIMIVITTLLDVSTMSIADLTGRLKEVEEAFEEALTSLQQDGKLYLIEEEWDARRKKRGVENHSGSGARGGGAGKGHGHGRGRLLHQAGRRASPPATSVTRSLRRSRCMSCKMKGNAMMEEMDAIEEWHLEPRRSLTRSQANWGEVGVQGKVRRVRGGVQAQGTPCGEGLRATAWHQLRRSLHADGSAGLDALSHRPHGARG
jgi:hypothetical protein